MGGVYRFSRKELRIVSCYHVPILLNEVIDLLKPERGGIFVDGTLGGGGHSEAILKSLPQGSHLYGIDRDADALKAAGERLSVYGDNFTAVWGNFFDMPTLLNKQGVEKVDGIMLDLGVSSHQLDVAERGFSYKQEAPLDMRMDQSAPLSAYEVVNGYSEQELCDIFFRYGEERFSRRIAGQLIAHRQIKPIETTTELAQIIKAAIPAKFKNEPQHPARRCFQAIRIEVNGELKGLEQAILQAHQLLNVGGRLCILTFHSLEDRIVKTVFRSLEQPCTCPKSAPICICGKKPTVRILTKKPLVASAEEQRENSRATSAKLRAIEKILQA